MPVQIPADADLNTLRTPGFYWCDGATNANRPDDSGSFCLLVEKTGSWAGNGVKQTYTNYDPGIIHTRVSPAKDVWNPWKPIASATPPQEFDLPLESSFQNFLQERSVYGKDQFSVVNLDISVQPVSEIAVDTVIAYLPEGFRPAKNKRAAAIAVTPENECIAFPLFVGTSGMVSIAFFSAQPAQYKAIIGQIEFVADG